VAVREAKASRQAEALAKLAVAMKAGKKPQDAINEVAAEYPDVALDVAGKFMREGNIGSLGSLLR
jgi:hypothetical protein